ncbi:hypothetical protein [Pseudosulfitobacter sp. DSM 107133]|uniref:hypothetical protein n=1 Tax=Pseudosulfitobacter sp. DSM 107133 TaxID=2883100 RepID=UPI001F0842FB|nr:hypothetical protein [Pseudosulfitobacter sp. DSM 107133]
MAKAIARRRFWRLLNTYMNPDKTNNVIAKVTSPICTTPTGAIAPIIPSNTAPIVKERSRRAPSSEIRPNGPFVSTLPCKTSPYSRIVPASFAQKGLTAD